MKSDSTEINGTTYKVTQVGAKVGRRIMLKLASALGAATTKPGAEAIEAAIQAIDPDDFDFLCDAFAANTKIVLNTVTAKGPGQIEQPLSGVFDSHFAGNYVAMIKWLAFCFKLNFADFFDGAASIVQSLAAPKNAENSEPPTASIGSSGV